MNLATARTTAAQAERDHDANPTAARWSFLEEARSTLRQQEHLAKLATDKAAAEAKAATESRFAELCDLCARGAFLEAIAADCAAIGALAVQATAVIARLDAAMLQHNRMAQEATALARELGLPETDAPAFVMRAGLENEAGRAVHAAMVAAGRDPREQVADFFQRVRI